MDTDGTRLNSNSEGYGQIHAHLEELLMIPSTQGFISNDDVTYLKSRIAKIHKFLRESNKEFPTS